MKRNIIFLLIIFFVTFSFLFSGPPDAKGPNSYCPHQYVKLNTFMGVPVNCDEFVFIGAAAHPSYLLQKKFQRQNRPLYIVFGTVMGYCIYYLLYPFHEQIKSFAYSHLSSQFSNQEIQKVILYGSVYISYIILNIIILFYSIVFLEKSIFITSGNWKNSRWLFYSFIVMLISNQVTKSFFWTAHQQMFTIFTPIACIYIGLTILKKIPTLKTILLMSLACGLMLLVYGNFLLVLPVMLFSYFLSLKRQAHFLSPSSLKNAILIVITFSLPTFIWIGALKLKGIAYYNHEVSAFRHFVWILDSIKVSAGYFFTLLTQNVFAFFKTFGSLLLSILVLLSALLSRITIRSTFAPLTDNQKTVRSFPLLIFIFLLFFSFLLLIGSYADRLTFSLAPILVFGTSILVNKQKLSLKEERGLAFFILTLHIYTTIFNAPHFSQELFYQ